MEKTYKIEIEETLERVVEVKANSLDEAIDMVTEQYKCEEIVLDYNDYMGVEIREFDDLENGRKRRRYER